MGQDDSRADAGALFRSHGDGSGRQDTAPNSDWTAARELGEKSDDPEGEADAPQLQNGQNPAGK